VSAEGAPSGGRLLLRRGGTLLLSNTAGQGLAFLTSIAVARLLGVERFGEYAAIMALVFLLGIVADAGIELSLSREVARDPRQSRPLLLASLRARAVTGGLIAGALALPPVAAALAPSAGAVSAVQLAGLLIILNVWNGGFAAVFRAWGRMEYVLLINVAGLSVQFAGALAVLAVRPSVLLLIGWLALVQVGELIGGVALFRRGEARAAGMAGPRGQPAAATAWALARRSWPFLIAGALGALALRVDLLLIEAARGPAAAGVYSVATRLHDLLVLAPNAFFAALLPALAAEHGARGAAGAAQIYSTVARRMALAGAVGAVAGLTLADLLVRLSFGPAYQEAAAPLRVLALLLIPLLINRTTSVRLYATGREGLATGAQALNLALRAGLGWPLVHLWGPPGAALANLIAESVMLGVYWLTGAMRPAGAGLALQKADP
jgi:O-antigen/teichoic acid export membrane protein